MSKPIELTDVLASGIEAAREILEERIGLQRPLRWLRLIYGRTNNPYGYEVVSEFWEHSNPKTLCRVIVLMVSQEIETGHWLACHASVVRGNKEEIFDLVGDRG